MYKTIYPINSLRFWQAYWITMRPYLLFVSAVAGMAGFAAGSNTGIGATIGALLAFFLSYGFGQALTDCFQTDTDSISSPYQINKPHEADAELIEIDGNDSDLLAITIDSVSEEITTGLYRDPFTMGWVTIMSNFSDLAAVGASPLGIVTAISIEPTRSKAFCQGIAQGMSVACSELGTFILGGDTNSTQRISLRWMATWRHWIKSCRSAKRAEQF